MKKEDNTEFVSKRTKRGILLLVFLCLLIIYIPRIISVFRPSEKIELTTAELKIIEELKTDYQAKQKAKKRNTYKKREFRRPPSKFNPNEYSKKEWMHVGLSEKQAEVMLKITKRGIWTNEFLQSITILPDEVYELIKDSTIYPERSYPKYEQKKYPQKEAYKRAIIEINSASPEEITSLPGIGPSFANRIVAYRKMLGGYHKKEQLLEVYGLDIERYDMFDVYFKVDSDAVKKLNINTSTVKELKSHPYINYAVANSIVKMREQHGAYKSLDQLKESKLIGRELFDKLKPYVYL